MKRIPLTLTEKQWIRIIEGLDETGKAQAFTPKRVPDYAKSRANGRALKALAASLRKKLAGKW